MQIMHFSSDDVCKYSLGISCRCLEFKNIVDNFKVYNIGSLHSTVHKLYFEEPIASAKVFWTHNRMEVNKDVTKPIIHFTQVTKRAETYDKKMWMPIPLDLVSLKYIQP